MSNLKHKISKICCSIMLGFKHKPGGQTEAIHQLQVWHNNHCITPPSHISWSNVLKFKDLNTHVLYIIFLFCTLRAFYVIKSFKAELVKAMFKNNIKDIRGKLWDTTAICA